MSQDETRGLNKNLDFMRAISILFLVMNVYYFCYPYFLSMNLNIGVVDKILLNFQRDTGLFSHSLVSKSFSLLFLFFSGLIFVFLRKACLFLPSALEIGRAHV